MSKKSSRLLRHGKTSEDVCGPEGHDPTDLPDVAASNPSLASILVSKVRQQMGSDMAGCEEERLDKHSQPPWPDVVAH